MNERSIPALTPAKGRLVEMDVARALAAIAVVALHVIGYSLSKDSAGSGGQIIDQALILSLRFARQVFMFISGFALAYAYSKRRVQYGTFLSKRAWRVVVPYLVWSAIYLAVAMPQDQSVRALLGTVMMGTAFYHLYYVVVSFQWYLVFLPVLAIAKRLGRKALWWSAITVAALYLGLAGWLTAGAPLPEWASALKPLLAHRDQLLVSYIGYYLLGTLAGIHAEAVLAWLLRHARIAITAMGGIVAFLLVDLVHDGTGQFAQTIDVFRPALVLYGFAGVAVVLAASGQIVRSGGKLLNWMQALSRNSYAIYLSHPLVLFLVEGHLLSRLHWQSPLVSVPLVLIGVLVPLVIATVLRSTPVAPLLLGQGSLWPWRRANPAQQKLDGRSMVASAKLAQGLGNLERPKTAPASV